MTFYQFPVGCFSLISISVRLALISKCTQDDDSAGVVPSAVLLWKRNALILPVGEPYVTQPCPQVFPLFEWLVCTNPPSQCSPHSLTATWTSTSFLWAVNRYTAGLFPAPCPHLLLIHHQWVTTWEAVEIKLWTRHFHNFSSLTRVILFFFFFF